MFGATAASAGGGESKPLLGGGGGGTGGVGGTAAAASAALPPSPKLYGGIQFRHAAYQHQQNHPKTATTAVLAGYRGGGGGGRAAAVGSTSFLSDDGGSDADGGGGGDDGSDDDEDHHKTSVKETFVHLVKGYLGAGCLSLPWAVSQLGLLYGVLSIVMLSIWSSYNCWSVVQIKRHIEQEQIQQEQYRILKERGGSTVQGQANDVEGTEAASSLAGGGNAGTGGGAGGSIRSGLHGTGGGDEASSVVSGTTNRTNATSAITYADVGEWAYGKTFQEYTRACVCTQQLAICTVFISFVGENLLALLHYLNVRNHWIANHTSVMTVSVPFILALSFLPTIKSLVPVMAAASVLLIASFAAIGITMEENWEYRPATTPKLNPTLVPLAMCAILYSYEGINLILPVESAMKEPQHFDKVFVAAMTTLACILGGFAAICVIVFGYVNSGSMTAYLLVTYADSPSIIFWVMVANTAVSLSVLLSYPLQMFPALELLAPMMSKSWPFRLLVPNNGDDDGRDGSKGPKNDVDDVGVDDDLEAFEPLPPIGEHEHVEFTEDSFPFMEHKYDEEYTQGNKSAGEIDPDADDDGNVKGDDGGDDDGDGDDNNDAHSHEGGVSDFKSAVSSIVGTEARTSPMEGVNDQSIQGDSMYIRASLVLMTYMVAVAIPNVQSLISLAGALAGSSTALLIPPILELAWMKQVHGGAVPVVTTPVVLDPATKTCSTANIRKRIYAIWSDKLLFPKMKCYFLFLLGFVFMGIGTYSSIVDIIRIYNGGAEAGSTQEETRRVLLAFT